MTRHVSPRSITVPSFGTLQRINLVTVRSLFDDRYSFRGKCWFWRPLCPLCPLFFIRPLSRLFSTVTRSPYCLKNWFSLFLRSDQEVISIHLRFWMSLNSRGIRFSVFFGPHIFAKWRRIRRMINIYQRGYLAYNFAPIIFSELFSIGKISSFRVSNDCVQCVDSVNVITGVSHLTCTENSNLVLRDLNSIVCYFF